MGDAFQPDGRKRRIEATRLRKTVFGKKHSRLDDTKVWPMRWKYLVPYRSIIALINRKMILLDVFATFWG